MVPIRRAFLMAAFEQYAGILISFVMVAVLARLLSPEEIGISVIGLAVTAITFSLREFVTADCLIQFETIDRNDTNTVFTILGMASLVLGGLLGLAATEVARFYGNTGLVPFLLLTATAAMIDATSMPGAALLRRKLAFGTLAAIRTTTTLSYVVSTILLAIGGHGYMSYAMGTIFGSVVGASMTAIASAGETGLPRPSLASWQKILDFGRYKGSSAVVDRILESLPQAMLGRLLPAAQVAIYNRSNVMCAVPDRLVMSALFSILFPALAAETRNGRDVKELYLRMLALVAVLYWPAVIMLGLLAAPAVAIVLGDQWSEAVPVLRYLAFSSVFFFAVPFAYPVLIAKGANRDAFVMSLLGRSTAAIILCASAGFGLMAMVFSQFFSVPLQLAVALYFVHRHLRFKWAELGEHLFPSAWVTLAAVSGPLAFGIYRGTSFQFTMTEVALLAALAATGWLVGLMATRHPLLVEIALMWAKLCSLLPGFSRFAGSAAGFARAPTRDR